MTWSKEKPTEAGWYWGRPTWSNHPDHHEIVHTEDPMAPDQWLFGPRIPAPENVCHYSETEHGRRFRYRNADGVMTTLYPDVPSPRLALLEAVVEAAAKLMAELNDGGIKSIATEEALEAALDNYNKEEAQDD